MVEAIAYVVAVIATETAATGILRQVCGEKLKTVPDNDWAAFAKAVTDQRESSSVTPDSYYEYYYWKNLARRIASRL